MRYTLVLLDYIWWHYTTGIKELVVILSNLCAFIVRFFSLPQLAATLFKPWRRLGEAYPNNFDIKLYAEVFIVNTLMRLVSAFIKTLMIIVGLIVLCLGVLISIFFFVLWLAYPLVVFGLVVFGLYLLLS